MAPEMHWIIGAVIGVAILAVGLAPFALMFLVLTE